MPPKNITKLKSQDFFIFPDQNLWLGGGGGATHPFRGMGAWKNSTETQQSGHVPRSGPEVKNGRNGA